MEGQHRAVALKFIVVSTAVQPGANRLETG